MKITRQIATTETVVCNVKDIHPVGTYGCLRVDGMSDGEISAHVQSSCDELSERDGGYSTYVTVTSIGATRSITIDINIPKGVNITFENVKVVHSTITGEDGSSVYFRKCADTHDVTINGVTVNVDRSMCRVTLNNCHVSGHGRIVDSTFYQCEFIGSLELDNCVGATNFRGGNEDRLCIAYAAEHNLMIRAGCFSGDTTEFAEAVRERYDDLPVGDNYIVSMMIAVASVVNKLKVIDKSKQDRV